MDIARLHKVVLWVMDQGAGSRIRKPDSWLPILTGISKLCQ
jgi:hypothetical protein